MQSVPETIREFSALLGIQFSLLSPDKLWQEPIRNNDLKSFYSLNKMGEVNGLLLHNFLRPKSQFNHDLRRLAWFPELEMLDLQRVLPDMFEVEALEHCRKLRLLCLDNNGLESIGPIGACPSLVKLSLHKNRINSIEPLASLTGLETLWLGHNRIQDLRPLASLISLEKLWAQSNQISDITHLAGLTGLKQLGLHNNQIEDISSLGSLTRLESLWLYNNKIQDVSSLANLSGLVELKLKNNLIRDLSPIAHLQGQYVAYEQGKLVVYEVDDIPLVDIPASESLDLAPTNDPEPTEPPPSVEFQVDPADPDPDDPDPNDPDPPDTDQGPGVAKVTNDGIEGGDLLGVEEELRVIAQALAMASVHPPLVVGLLGGWGSGKSFAMHLIRKELANIRALPAELLPDGSTTTGQVKTLAYVGHLYTIDFNAWTYAKSNLWASLMQEIFTQLDTKVSLEQLLAKHLAEQTQNSNQTKELTIAEVLGQGGTIWEALLQPKREGMNALKMQIGSEHIKELNKDGNLWDQLAQLQKEQRKKYEEKLIQLHSASTKKSDAEQALKAAEADLEARKKAALEKAEWNAMADILGEALTQDVAKELGFPGVKLEDFAEKCREEFAQTLGIPKRELGSVTETLKRLTHQASSFSLASLNLPSARRILLLVALMSLLPLVASHFYELKGTLSALWAEGLVAGAWLLSQWKEHKERLTSWVEMAKKLSPDKETLDRKRKETLEKFNKEPSNAEPLEQAREMANKAEKALSKAQAEVTEARQRAGFVACHQSLNDFLQFRLDEGGYREKLGLMHQVQQDLAELSEMLMGQGLEHELFPRGKPRVVLFIDDLDRCPPEMVVQVLEATQLLCKTDLFVVVLAVDMRYVTRALEKTYAGILNKTRPPTGLDYVEKIIQIPYQMHLHAAESLAQLFGTTLTPEQESTARTATPTPELRLSYEVAAEGPAAEHEVIPYEATKEPQVELSGLSRGPGGAATSTQSGPSAIVTGDQPQVPQSRGLGFTMGPSGFKQAETATPAEVEETSKPIDSEETSKPIDSKETSLTQTREVRAQAHQVNLSQDEGRQLALACEAARLTPRSSKRVGNNYCLIKAVLLNQLRTSLEGDSESKKAPIDPTEKDRALLCVWLVLVEAWPEQMGVFFQKFREAEPTKTLEELLKEAGIRPKPWLEPIAQSMKSDTDPKIMRLIRAFSFITETEPMPKPREQHQEAY